MCWRKKDVASEQEEGELREGDVVAWLYQNKIAHAAVVISLQGHLHLFHCAKNMENLPAVGSRRPFSGVMLTSMVDEMHHGRASLCVIFRPSAKIDVRTLRWAIPEWYGEAVPPGAGQGVAFARRALSAMGAAGLIADDGTVQGATEVGIIECTRHRTFRPKCPEPLSADERSGARDTVTSLLLPWGSLAQRV